MTDYPIEAVDRDVRRLLELAQAAETIVSESNAIKARLRALGNGEHPTPCGATVTVTPPNRTFNLDRAVTMLNDEQRDLAKPDGYDAKKVKQFLPPTLLEQCMDPGTGDLRVSVK
jgi:hypothetical protein